MVVYGPGIVATSDSTERVTLADLAPTTATLIGSQTFPADERQGRPLPLSTARSARTPKIVFTFVFDGGGWNVLHKWPDAWPNLKRLMGEGANFRNAIHGSFPAVTACAHATIGTGTYPTSTASPATTSATTPGSCARPTANSATPTRPTSCCPRCPTSGTTRPRARRGWAKIGIRSGTWA
jgi:hypothetical protein